MEEVARGKLKGIKGVAVLYAPITRPFVLQDIQSAQLLLRQIQPGSVLVLPSDRDSQGMLLWDFRIEGGETTQVKIGRLGITVE